MYREDIVRILYKVADKQTVTIEEGMVLNEWLEQSDYSIAYTKRFRMSKL